MSQVFPTTPKNVFRVSFTREIEQSRWQMSEQGFELSHIGKMFFNHEVQNKSGYFSYNRDNVDTDLIIPKQIIKSINNGNGTETVSYVIGALNQIGTEMYFRQVLTLD